MKIEDVLAIIGEEECIESVSPYWDESQDTFPADGLPSFLQPLQIQENRQAGLLAEYMEPQILDVAKQIADDPNLLHLAWHCYRLTYHHADYRAFAKWPTFEKSLSQDRCGIFYLLVGMAMVPIVRKVHADKGIDETITRDTLSDIRCFNIRYGNGNDGRIGLVKNELSWFRHHSEGELYRLGRLQYFLHEFGGCGEIYRNRQTKETIALSEDGTKVRTDGYCVFWADDENAPKNWTASHTIDTEKNTATGNVIAPNGIILKEKVTLDLNEWEHVVTKETGMLSMHIPAGGAMTLDLCIASMRQAIDFFPKIFPDRPFAGIDCCSWIFGNQLEDMLEPESNLVQFLRMGYLYPKRTSPKEGLHFIFYRLDGNIEKFPRDNDLQGKILDWINAKKPWRGSGWFVLNDDVDKFHEQYYRSHWPPQGIDI